MRITLKTAKLAKEKGFNSIRKQDVSDSYYNRFNGKTFHFYMNDEFVVAETNSNLIFGLIDNYQGKTTPYEYYLAPNQADLQKWLREKHDIVVWVHPKSHHYYEYQILTADNHIISSERSHNWEEIFELGLFATLSLI